MDMSNARRLAEDIRASEEYQRYHQLKEAIGDETTMALLKEYRKLQVKLQVAAMGGPAADSEDMQRFQGIAGLLFSKPEVSQYLLAEMQLQQSLAEIFRLVTEAAGLDMELPGLG